MKEKILKNVAQYLCDDFVDTICTGFEESSNDFPFTLACANFIYELKSKGININISLFAQCPDIFDNMYNELSKYLSKVN